MLPRSATSVPSSSAPCRQRPALGPSPSIRRMPAPPRPIRDATVADPCAACKPALRRYRRLYRYPAPPCSLPSSRASSRCSPLVRRAARPGFEGAHLLAGGEVGGLRGALEVERVAAPVARQHLAPDQSPLLQAYHHRAHGRLVDAEGGGQHHLRDARIGAYQRQHAERAGREVEAGQRRLELAEDLGLRAPNQVADVGGQLVEIDRPRIRLGGPLQLQRCVRPFHAGSEPFCRHAICIARMRSRPAARAGGSGRLSPALFHVQHLSPLLFHV